jgi:hypothetical protein
MDLTPVQELWLSGAALALALLFFLVAITRFKASRA